MKNIEISSSLLEAAKKAAQAMIKSGESVQKFKFGRTEGFFWISRDADKIIGPEELVVDDVKFYFGMFKA